MRSMPTQARAAIVIERDPETGRALTVRLPTGHTAYYQRREDDCDVGYSASVPGGKMT